MSRAILAVVLATTGVSTPSAAAAPMARIQGGCVFVGCQPDRRCPQSPRRRVCLSSYAIDRTEVTNEAYRDCVRAGVCTRPFKALDRPKHPVAGVTWKQAHTYCAWVGKRLPTEAEWERAARGPTSRAYPWGNFGPDRGVAVIGDDTAPVCSRPEGNSPDGLCDMAGNIAEWVHDWYDQLPRRWRAKRTLRDPKGPCGGHSPCKGHRAHVLKGGSHGLVDPFHNISFRVAPKRDFWIRSGQTGFRCATTVRTPRKETGAQWRTEPGAELPSRMRGEKSESYR